MLDYPGAFNTVMDSDLTNGNLRRIVGVWGALPNVSVLSQFYGI